MTRLEIPIDSHNFKCGSQKRSETWIKYLKYWDENEALGGDKISEYTKVVKVKPLDSKFLVLFT